MGSLRWRRAAFIGYVFDAGSVSKVVVMRAQKPPTVGEEIMLEALGCEVFWLQATSYASVKIRELKYRRLNGEINEEEVPDDDIPAQMRSICYIRVTLVGRKMFGAVESVVTNAWENLKAELTNTQLVVPTTVEKVLNVLSEALPSHDDFRMGLMALEEMFARGVQEHEMSEVELPVARLMLKLIESLKKRVLGADETAAAAVSQVLK